MRVLVWLCLEQDVNILSYIVHRRRKSERNSLVQTKFQILERKEPKMTRLEKVRHGLDMGQLINEVVITIVKEDPGPSINAVENVIVFPWLFWYVFLLESSSIPISEKRTLSRLEKKTEFSQHCLLSWFDLCRCLASGLCSSPKRLRSCRSAGSIPE